MDGKGFDGMTRTMGAAVTRRAAATGLLGGGLAGLLALAGAPAEADAGKRRKRRRKQRRRRRDRCLPNGAPITLPEQEKCCDGIIGENCSKPCLIDGDCNPDQTCLLVGIGDDGFCLNDRV